MSSWWQVGVGLVAALLLIWVAMVLAFWASAPDDLRVRQAMRLLPDLLRLLRGLASDRALPRGVRLRLWLLLGYLAMPIDLIPDFVPVIGYADDAVVVAMAVRSVARRAGPEALERHWPGTPDGLAAVRRLTGLPTD